MQHDGAGLEQYQPVLLVRGDLPERLKATIALGRPIVRPDQPLLVWKARLFERPAHAKVTHQAAGEGRYPTESTHPDHGRLRYADFGACQLRGMGWSMLTRLPSVSVNETYCPTPGISTGSPST